MSKSLGLALGGGGARGVAHIGFLQALEEENITPQYICGTSMGSVVGACYAKGMTVAEMKQAVFDLGMFDIISLSAAPMGKLGISGTKKLKRRLQEVLGNSQFSDLKIPFQCTASDVLSNQLVVFDSGDLVTAVQASSSIPGLFRPVRLDGKLLLDGGILCRVPSRQVKAMGADVVIGVDVLNNTSQPVSHPTNLVALLLRVFDMMDNNAAQYAKKANKDVCDLYLEPPIAGYSQYSVKDFEKPFEEGYLLGKANMKKIKKLLSE